MKYALAVILLLYAGAASAATCSNATYGGACTITNSSALAVTLPTQTTVLAIDNESASATIACAFANGTAALNTAGSWTIPPGFTRTWFFGPKLGLINPGILNCISGAATSPATIEVH